MVDKFSRKKRSSIMSRVKGKDTQPEKAVRTILHRMGYRFRLYRSDLPGKPDIVLSKHKKIIFVHGCFWHGHKGCERAGRPSTNVEFWNQKLSANIKRDSQSVRDLRKQGWKVLIVWACQIRNADRLHRTLTSFLERSDVRAHAEKI